MPGARFSEILERLVAHEVDFIVVGMAPASYTGPGSRPSIWTWSTVAGASAVEMKIAGGGVLRVLSLPALIEAKQQAGRPKDLAVLPVLRATLDEGTRRS